MITDVKLNDGESGDQDSRHNTEACGSETSVASIKGHFAWSLAHLAEALVFYSVTMYSDDGVEPNLTKFSSSMDSLSTSEFVSSIYTF